jgi:ABC transporter, phosphonate, periplasmic substrate-binding protein
VRCLSTKLDSNPTFFSCFYVHIRKQVVFTYNQVDVIAGILDGQFDVGFVRTDSIERTVDADGNPVDSDLFKVIEPKIHILDDGNLFPFLFSTDIYPEWPVAALDHVNKDVSEEVQRALLNAGRHAKLGSSLEMCKVANIGTNSSPCDVHSLPEYVEFGTVCDTTNELVELAYNGSVVGKWAGFRTSRSYFQARTMQEAAGFIVKDEKGNWKCTRAVSTVSIILSRCKAGVGT